MTEFLTQGDLAESSLPTGTEQRVLDPGVPTVPLGQQLSAQYPWVKNCDISIFGSRALWSVPLGQELSAQYPWIKNSLFNTPGSRTLCSVPLR